MFHWKDGWFFDRVAIGSDLGVVHIVKRETAHPDSPIVVEAFVPAAEWASIMASVSVEGETSYTWPLAVAFHNGGQALAPSR